jgi:hypothetical protein
MKLRAQVRFSSSKPKVVASNAMDTNLDLPSDDLSSVMGTETLVAHDMVPEGLPASRKEPAEHQVHHVESARYRRSLLYPATLGLDTFAWPATSCECERAFSRTEKLITPERNVLVDNIIEALECLRVWWNNGLVKRL